MKILTAVLHVFVLLLCACPSSNDALCATPSKCSAEPATPAVNIEACQYLAASLTTCAAEHHAQLKCYVENEQCTSANTHDGVATENFCRSFTNAKKDCLAMYQLDAGP